jgi:uncharacterized membrane protein
MGAAPPPAAGPVYQPPVAATGMADNVASALCYALGFITGIIFLVLAPYNQNKTVRFHAFQSIFFSVAVIAIRIVLSIVLTAVLGFYTMLTVQSLVSLCFFGLWLYLLIMAYQGKTVVLPVVGPLAQKQA